MFTVAFWKTTGEAVVTTFVTAFGGTFIAQQRYTVTALIAAASAGGLAAVAVLLKQVGGVQATNATPKVTVKGK